MAAGKLVAVLTLFLALVFTTGVIADAPIGGEDATVKEVVGFDGVDASGLKIQVDQLNSKIRALESQIYEKAGELRNKEEIIMGKEKVLQERLDRIASLQAEVSSLQQKGSSDAAEQVGKAQARAVELEKQIERLKKELETKTKEKKSIEARKSEAERKLRELDTQLEKLRKTKDEQTNKIQKLERAIKMAEEELFKAKHEATSKTKELLEVHGAWLPPWLAGHWISLRAIVETRWNNHGKPVMDKAIQVVTEKKAQAENWAEPHLEIVKIKYIPAVKKQWAAVASSIGPHVKSLSTKAKKAYDASKTAVIRHIDKVQGYVDPYYREAKKFSKPYIDQVARVTQPHVDNIRVAMRPYSKKIIRAYRKFLESATTYHKQVQASVEETLKKHEFTRPLATKELEWFAASALLALPILFLLKVFSAMLCKNTKKLDRHSHNHHSRRKAKRGHKDK